MKKNNPISGSILRQNAEEFLKKKKSKFFIHPTDSDVLSLIHELEVHQIELEMINEDLLLTQEKNRVIAEKYTELFDFAPVGYFILSRDGTIIEANLSGAKMLDRVRSRLINGRLAFFFDRDSKPIFNLFLENIFNSNIKEECDLKLATNSDTPQYVHLSGIVHEDNMGCLVTMMDISTRMEAEFLIQKKNIEIVARNEELTRMNEFLNLSNKKSDESDRLKSAFLANMSHEIRTPMNGILGFAELLKDKNLSGDDQQEYIEIIEKSGIRMLNIINEIIDISRIESKQMFLSISKTDINDQIKFIHTFFHPEAELKGIKLNFKTGLTADQSIIKTDKEKLYAILGNLVKNAIKYTDKGSIEFGYILKSHSEKTGLESKPDELEFFVKDTGIGIPKERQEAVFERFIQADVADKHAYQGAGLGLTISKSHVEMLGGKIWLDSEEGKGSAFYFTLPYEVATDETIDSEKISVSDDTKNQLSKLKILIVEDDHMSQMLLRNVLRTFSKEVLYATTGIEAIEACHNNPDIDLIMMDIKMPEMNGYEATRQIRQFNKEVIIIAQTSFALKGDKAKTIKAGCNDYISKPYKNSALVSMLKEYF